MPSSDRCASRRSDPIVVIGAGVGGLSAALSLAAAGEPVLVLEKEAQPGGKMRQVNGVDAGPTVLTLAWVFEELFAKAGTRLSDHVRLTRQEVLARHFWRDGTVLDLFADPDKSAQAIREMSGDRGASEFREFSDRARRLFDAFLGPMMLTPKPSLPRLVSTVLAQPRLMRDMGLGRSLEGLLRNSFTDPRLRQLFGRYATYVGGDPSHTPALYALIWHAEEQGVWAVDGGLSALAAAMSRQIEACGGEIRYDATVAEIETDGHAASGVRLHDDSRIKASRVIFNGDPRALAVGALGNSVRSAVGRLAEKPRSLSARVWAFSAKVEGPPICHHNVFFRSDPGPEFADIASGRATFDPTLYVCAEDRGGALSPPGRERFEIIINAPPLSSQPPDKEDFAQCLTRTFETLRAFDVSFDRAPPASALTTQAEFETLFPASLGSLYGQSPHGFTSALSRPTARSRIPGLYLCGGGVHPGPGVPMAALSGTHAAEAIMQDQTSTSRSHPMAMRGGTSTGSARTGNVPSRSSPS